MGKILKGEKRMITREKICERIFEAIRPFYDTDYKLIYLEDRRYLIVLRSKSVTRQIEALEKELVKEGIFSLEIIRQIIIKDEIETLIYLKVLGA